MIIEYLDKQENYAVLSGVTKKEWESAIKVGAKAYSEPSRNRSGVKDNACRVILSKAGIGFYDIIGVKN